MESLSFKKLEVCTFNVSKPAMLMPNKNLISEQFIFGSNGVFLLPGSATQIIVVSYTFVHFETQMLKNWKLMKLKVDNKSIKTLDFGG